MAPSGNEETPVLEPAHGRIPALLASSLYWALIFIFLLGFAPFLPALANTSGHILACRLAFCLGMAATGAYVLFWGRRGPSFIKTMRGTALLAIGSAVGIVLVTVGASSPGHLFLALAGCAVVGCTLAVTVIERLPGALGTPTGARSPYVPLLIGALLFAAIEALCVGVSNDFRFLLPTLPLASHIGLLLSEAPSTPLASKTASVSSSRSRLSLQPVLSYMLLFVAFGMTAGLMSLRLSSIPSPWLTTSQALAVAAVCAGSIILRRLAGLRTEQSVLRKASVPLIASGYLLSIASSGARTLAAFLTIGGFAALSLFAAELSSGSHSPSVSSTTLKPLSIAAASLGSGIGIVIVLIANALMPLRTPLGLNPAFAAAIVMLALAANALAPTDIGHRSQHDAPDATGTRSASRSLEDACRVLAASFGLTPRENDVLIYLAQGRDAKHIHQALRLSVNTVRTHMRRVYAKLDVHNQQELIDLVYATQASLANK